MDLQRISLPLKCTDNVSKRIGNVIQRIFNALQRKKNASTLFSLSLLFPNRITVKHWMNEFSSHFRLHLYQIQCQMLNSLKFNCLMLQMEKFQFSVFKAPHPDPLLTVEFWQIVTHLSIHLYFSSDMNLRTCAIFKMESKSYTSFIKFKCTPT